jgi:hypothetical protein
MNTLAVAQPHTTVFPAGTHSAIASSHHTGHGFIDTLLHGFAWRTGSDVADAIFHLAPTLIILAVVRVLIFVGVRWLRRRNQS